MHEDLFFKSPIEECVLNIELLQMPASRHSHGEEKVNRRGLDHRTKGVLIVIPIALLESLGNKSGFVMLNRAVGLVFNLEYPF